MRTIRLAIVNRGEAATRALSTLSELGHDETRYHTIALFTDPDRDAQFVRRADEAVHIGPAQFTDREDGRTRHSYLDHDRLFAALTAARTDAVWVGWGFVAEDAEFAAGCEARGIVFIGPNPASMRQLSDKITAKRVAEVAGVPVAPWSGGAVSDLAETQKHADRIGYPLMVKAAAGGGGRGIRLVKGPDELAAGTTDAMSEALHSFGDSSVFLERCIPSGRHLEVQVLADGHGTVWTLGVRECTAQRRRQKVLEESGLSVPDPALEEKLRQYARELCLAVGYTNAGTVEFLYDPRVGEAYFMEVNTRLQVEHTVTEMVTGVDLVAWQVAIAFGAKLPPSPPIPYGHAIEVRLNAEDPQQGFAPAPGRIVLFRPAAGPGVRVDSGVTEGDTVPPDFDSMVAKLIVWGADRPAALRRMKRALNDTRLLIAGGASNRGFLLELVQDPAVLAGTIHTSWIDETLAARANLTPHRAQALIIGAVESYERSLTKKIEEEAKAARAPESDGEMLPPKIELRSDDWSATVLVEKRGPTSFRLTAADGSCLNVDVESGSAYERALRWERGRISALLTEEAGGYGIEIANVAYRVVQDDAGAVRSRFPAIVVAHKVHAGTTVAAGDPLLIVESMKMESVIVSPIVGTVREMPCPLGAQVAAGTIVARIDRSGDASSGVDLTFRNMASAGAAHDAAGTLGAWLAGYDVTTQDAARSAEAIATLGEADAIDELLRSFTDMITADRPAISDGSEVSWRAAKARGRIGPASRLLQPTLMRGLANPTVLRQIASLGDAVGASIADLAASLLASIEQTAFDLNETETANRALDDALRDSASPTIAAVGLASIPVAWDRWLKSEVTPPPAGGWLKMLVGKPGTAPSRSVAALETYVRSRYGLCQTDAVTTHSGRGVPAAILASGGACGFDSLVVVAAAPNGARDALRAAASAASDQPGRAMLEILWPDAVPTNEGRNRVLRLLARALPPQVRRVVLTEVGRASACLVLDIGTNGYSPAAEFESVHPALAERFELWRLAAFQCEVLSASDHALFLRATARESRADKRLFAFGEVSASPSATSSSPDPAAWEQALSECLEQARQLLTVDPDRARLGPNRIVLTSRLPWTRPVEALSDIGKRLVGRTRGLSLDPITIRMSVEEPVTLERIDTVVQMAISPAGVQLGRKAPSDETIRPLDDLRARMALARRQGYVHPHEIVRLMTSPGVLTSDLPPGDFTEYDLDETTDRLAPVSRPAGRHTANLMVGIFTNLTEKHPEGMRRVAILGDPTHGLGSLGEAECRRVIAALALATAERLPIEWFAVSSGARVAMDSGTENLDWTARALREIVNFTQAGGTINVVVTGINVGAQSYWNAEATMLMHTRGTLIMVGDSAMVLTGKQALEYSGAVSAPTNTGIGGYEGIMGANGQAQHWAVSVEDACQLLFRHYDLTYSAPGEPGPRSRKSADLSTRDVRPFAHSGDSTGFETVGAVFSVDTNPGRKQPFDIRSVMDAVSDGDDVPLERWAGMADAENAVIRDVHLGGNPVCMVGIESRELQRRTAGSSDGPERWTAGTLFPLSSKKIARAINAASGNRPVVVLANLSGFDGSPESMRTLQLEYGAEIARAVVNFRGRIVFCVLSRYHGGAFVVFSKQLNPGLVSIAVEGSHASVLGGAPAAAVVFGREVKLRVDQEMARQAIAGDRTPHAVVLARVRGAVAREYDAVHTIARAREVGSIDAVVSIANLRPQIIDRLSSNIGTA